MRMTDTSRSRFARAYRAGRPTRNERRNLTEDDRLSWYDAAGEREKAIRPQTVADVQALVRNRNPIRWYQLQSDFRWLKKQMKKLGLNPEDARYML